MPLSVRKSENFLVAREDKKKKKLSLMGWRPDLYKYTIQRDGDWFVYNCDIKVLLLRRSLFLKAPVNNITNNNISPIVTRVFKIVLGGVNNN